MNLDSIIHALETVPAPGLELVRAALLKLVEARELADGIADAADVERPAELTATEHRALSFLCVSGLPREVEYCDACGGMMEWWRRCVVDLLPRTVGDASAGESATLCRACFNVATEGGAR